MTRSRGKPGELPGGVGQHVHRVGGDEDDAVGIVLGDLGNDRAEDVDVARDQIEARFTGALGAAGGDHRDGGSGAIGVITGPDTRRTGQRHGVVQVHRFAFRFGAVGVDQDDLACQAALQQGIGKRRAHIARPDDNNFYRAVQIFSRHSESLGGENCGVIPRSSRYFRP